MLLCHILLRVFWKRAKAYLDHQFDEIWNYYRNIIVSTSVWVRFKMYVQKGDPPECGQSKLRVSTHLPVSPHGGHSDCLLLVSATLSLPLCSKAVSPRKPFLP